MVLAKEQILQIITGNGAHSVTDVDALLCESFRGILQEMLEAEPDATLGYEKYHKTSFDTSNERKQISKYQWDVSGIEEKVIFFYVKRNEYQRYSRSASGSIWHRNVCRNYQQNN